MTRCAYTVINRNPNRVHADRLSVMLPPAVVLPVSEFLGDEIDGRVLNLSWIIQTTSWQQVRRTSR